MNDIKDAFDACHAELRGLRQEIRKAKRYCMATILVTIMGAAGVIITAIALR